MIPARKHPRFVQWFTKQVEKRIRKMFSAVHVRGLSTLTEAVASGPVIVVSNHTAWWDPMLCILVCHGLLKCDAYALMDAKNLARLPFLGRVGGFGVHLDDPADKKRVLAYTADLLTGPGRLVWIFPQGRERPRIATIDDFKPGAAIIARKVKDVAVFPVGIRYEFRSVPAPEAFLSIGPPLPSMSQIEADRLAQQSAVTSALDTIDQALLHPEQLTHFEKLYHRPAQSRLELLVESILARITRYRK